MHKVKRQRQKMHHKCLNHRSLSALHGTHTWVSPEYRRGATRIQSSENGACEQQRRQKEAGKTPKARGKCSFGSAATTEGHVIQLSLPRRHSCLRRGHELAAGIAFHLFPSLPQGLGESVLEILRGDGERRLERSHRALGWEAGERATRVFPEFRVGEQCGHSPD